MLLIFEPGFWKSEAGEKFGGGEEVGVWVGGDGDGDGGGDYSCGEEFGGLADVD